MASSPGLAKMDREYQAEDDVRTLERAHEVKRDPKRHSAAKRHATKKAASFRRISKGR